MLEFDSYEEAEKCFLENIPFNFIQNFRFAYLDDTKEMKEFNFLKDDAAGIEEKEEEVYMAIRKIMWKQ